jgi:hypothetical protein
MSSDNSAGHVSRHVSSNELSSDIPSSDNGRQLHGEWADIIRRSLKKQEVDNVLKIAQKILAEVTFVHGTFAEEDMTCDSISSHTRTKTIVAL